MYSHKPIRAKIIYETLSDGNVKGYNDSDPATGSYKLAFPVGANYGYNAQADGYLSVNQNLNAMNMEEGQTMEQDLYLIPLKKGSIIALNNIFFDYNKTELKKESYPELIRLAKIMKDNPKMKIAIGGHTDSRGSDEYNMQLSSDRAESVRQYLLKQGVDSKRMAIKKLGKSAPLTANETSPDGAALNRRVDITLED
jgi:outer membrane protein OmpA-like peptidoglycan-associated protein